MAGSGDELYRRLQALDLRPTENFINLPEGLEGAFGEQRRVCSYPTPLTWKDVLGQEFGVGPFMVKTNCWTRGDGPPGNHRNWRRFFITFVRLGGHRLRNLHDYAKLVQRSVVTRADHRLLYDYLRFRECAAEHVLRAEGAFRTCNSNLEVPILHFKLRERRPLTRCWS
jgi:hypothetical protein